MDYHNEFIIDFAPPHPAQPRYLEAAEHDHAWSRDRHPLEDAMTTPRFAPNVNVQQMSDAEMRRRLLAIPAVETIVRRYRNEILHVGDDHVVVCSDHPQGKDPVERTITFDEIRGAEREPSGDNGRIKQALHHALAQDL